MENLSLSQCNGKQEFKRLYNTKNLAVVLTSLFCYIKEYHFIIWEDKPMEKIPIVVISLINFDPFKNNFTGYC